MNFANLTGLSDSYGNVVQIADASGRVLWSANKLQEDRAVLTVAKETDTTIAGETIYENESFILLNIYPLSGGTVNVTYGGLTKTITDDGTSETPNAQSVYFGTLYGVSDSVSTPDSGTLTIEGNFSAYGCGDYTNRKSTTSYCLCITNVVEIGKYITTIPRSAFQGCTSLTGITIPNSVTSIGESAFRDCTSLTGITIPNSVTSIGEQAFYNCTSLTGITIPNSVTSIGEYTFRDCTSLTGITIPNSVTSIGEQAFYNCTSLTSIPLVEGIVNIGDEAFCMILSNMLSSNPLKYGSVVIPSTVNTIGENAFAATATDTIYRKAYLRTVQFLSKTPPTKPDGTKITMGSIFGVTSNNDGKWIVPAGCIDTYESIREGWQNEELVEAS